MCTNQKVIELQEIYKSTTICVIFTRERVKAWKTENKTEKDIQTPLPSPPPPKKAAVAILNFKRKSTIENSNYIIIKWVIHQEAMTIVIT